MRLFHRTYGQGEPLVILHGFLGCSDNWHTIAQQLSGQFLVIVPDLRNHGRSPHAPECGIPAMTADVLGLLDELRLPQVKMLGHSLGGKVAMRLALSAPDRVGALIAADVAMHAYPSARLAPLLAAMQAFDPATVATRGEADAALAGAIHSPAVRQLLVKNLVRGEDGQLCWRCNVAAFVQGLAGMVGGVDLPGRTFAGPALVLCGGRSDYVTDAGLEEIRRHFPCAESATIPEAGHWVHADAPGAFLQRVTEFLFRE